MKQIAVVYWSGTGNTEAMANAVAEGVTEAGAQANILTCDDFTQDMMETYDAIAFGCPSMGDEVLEETEFEPMFTSVKDSLKGKTIALFGSYDWGDGEWMRNWDQECRELGAVIAADFVICNNTPDDDGLAACKALGSALLK